MNKWIKFGLLGALALAVVFAGVGVAAAQSEDPTGPEGPYGPHHGPGMGPIDGPLAEYREIVDQALADALGISLQEFEAAREQGERLFELAETYDVELEELRTAMDEARAEILEQALEDGAISEEQAEWMQEAPRPRGPHLGGCHGEGPMRDGFGGFGSRGGRWGGDSQ